MPVAIILLGRKAVDGAIPGVAHGRAGRRFERVARLTTSTNRSESPRHLAGALSQVSHLTQPSVHVARALTGDVQLRARAFITTSLSLTTLPSSPPPHLETELADKGEPQAAHGVPGNDQLATRRERECLVGEARGAAIHERCEQLAAARALHCQQRARGALISHVRVKPAVVEHPPDPREVLRRGVPPGRDVPPGAVVEAREREVGLDATSRVAERSVRDRALGATLHIRAAQPLHGRAGVGARDDELAEVRLIEERDALARGAALLGHRLVARRPVECELALDEFVVSARARARVKQ